MSIGKKRKRGRESLPPFSRKPNQALFFAAFFFFACLFAGSLRGWLSFLWLGFGFFCHVGSPMNGRQIRLTHSRVCEQQELCATKICRLFRGICVLTAIASLVERIEPRKRRNASVFFWDEHIHGGASFFSMADTLINCRTNNGQ
jgi:hypothetical protein